MLETKLDNIQTVLTPEGVIIEQKLAGIWSRSYAWLIDLAIRILIYIVLISITTYMGVLGMGLLLIGIFIVEWFYPVFFEVLFNGKTPGKRILNIRVVNADATAIGWSESLLRNLLRTVDFLPFLYATGLVSILMTDKFQRIGDLAANTLVVYDEDTKLVTDIPYSEPRPYIDGLTLSEQKIILKFAERVKNLSEERKEELATYLSSNNWSDMTSNKLLSQANYIIGRQ